MNRDMIKVPISPSAWSNHDVRIVTNADSDVF